MDGLHQTAEIWHHGGPFRSSTKILMGAIPVRMERSRWFWEAWYYKIPWKWEKETMLTSWVCIVVHLGIIPMAKTGCKKILGGLSSAQSAVRFAVCLCVGRQLYGRTAKLQCCVLPKSLWWSDSAHNHFMTGISRNPKWVIKNAKSVFSIQTIPPGDVSSLGPGAFVH